MSAAETAPPVERITYLVANFNQEPYLPDCLRSLAAQTDDRWEAVVWDDASTDGSVEVVRAFDHPRVQLVVSPVNVGYVAALQNLLDLADSDIVGILDPDDALAPEATELVLRAYAEDPEAAFVHSRAAIYDEALDTCRGTRGAPVPVGASILEAGFVGAIKSFRRSAYRRTDGLDADFVYAEDRDLVYKLEEVARPVFVDAVLYRCRETPGSQSRDPRKREIGAVHHLRAKRRAMNRRDVGGLARRFCGLLFRCEYVEYSRRRAGVVRALAGGLRRALLALDSLVGVRRRALNPGREPAPPPPCVPRAAGRRSPGGP